MAIKFGRIDYSETSFDEQIFNKAQKLESGSEGTHHFHAIKDHYKTGTSDAGGGLLSVSGSHWAFLHNMFYMSGSQKVLETMPADAEKFNSYYHNFNQYNDLKPFWTSKFYDTASVFYIPQQKFGNRIKPGSFQLTARTGSSTNTTKEIVIVDDSNGNLYSTNAHHSQSNASALSSSENYVGNIFYDLGVATVTETGSWSGSIDYTDIGKKYNTDASREKDYRFWDLRFNSMTPIFTSQFSIKIPSGQFNNTMNATIKPHNNGEWIPSGSDIQKISGLKNELTGSKESGKLHWSPYFTQIHLYENTQDEPVMIANVPRPIKMRDDIDLIITFRVDH